MAAEDEVLGISGHLDISDIFNSINELYGELGKLKGVSAEMSNEVRKAFQSVANASDKDIAQRSKEALDVFSKAFLEAKNNAEANVAKMERSIERLQEKLSKVTLERSDTLTGTKTYDNLTRQMESLNTQIHNQQQALANARKEAISASEGYSTFLNQVATANSSLDAFNAINAAATTATAGNAVAHSAAAIAVGVEATQHAKNAEEIGKEVAQVQKNNDAVAQNADIIQREATSYDELIERIRNGAVSSEEFQRQVEALTERIQILTEEKNKLDDLAKSTSESALTFSVSNGEITQQGSEEAARNAAQQAQAAAENVQKLQSVLERVNDAWYQNGEAVENAAQKARQVADTTQSSTSSVEQAYDKEIAKISELENKLEELYKKKVETLRVGNSDVFIPQVPADMLANSGMTFGNETLESLRSINAEIKETQNQLNASQASAETLKEKLRELQEAKSEETADVFGVKSESYEQLKQHLENANNSLKELNAQAQSFANKDKLTENQAKEYERVSNAARQVEKEIKAINDEIANRRSETFVGRLQNAFDNVGNSVDKLKQKLKDGLSDGMSNLSEKLGIDKLQNNLSQSDGWQRFKAEAEQGKEAVNSFGAKIESLLTGNGKFQNSLKGMGDSFGALGAPIKAATGGLIAMTRQMWAMMATPLGAVIGAIVLGLQALSAWFKKSAEGQRALAQITAFSSSLLASFTDILVKVGEYLFKAFTQPQGALNGFAKGLVTTLKDAITTAVKLLTGLGNTLSGVGKMLFSFSAEGISEGWEQLKKGISDIKDGGASAINTVKDVFSTTVKGIGGVVSLASDGVKKLSSDSTDIFGSMKKIFADSMNSANLAGQQFDLTKKTGEAQEHSLMLEKQIAANREKIYTLTGKEKDELIEQTKLLQKQKYEGWTDEDGKRHLGILDVQREQLRVVEEQNKLHTVGVEQIKKERELRMQILQTETQQAASTRMLTRMQEANRRAMANAEKQGAKRDAKQDADTEKANARLNEVTYTHAKERTDAEKELQERINDARISAMKDGAKRMEEERQRQLEKELADIDKAKEAAIDAEYKRQKEEFEAQQALIKAQGGKPLQWDNSMFDANSKEIQSISNLYDELKKLTVEKQANEIVEEERNAMNEYLREYGTYSEKRKAIEDEYQTKITEARTEGEKLSLQKQMEEALASLDMERLKTAIDWDVVFGDLSKATNKQLSIVRSQLQNFVKGKEFKGMKADQQKAIMDALKDITAESEARNPFVEFANAATEYKAACEDVTNAQAAYDKALEVGTQAQIDAAKATLELTKATRDQSQLKLAQSIGNIGNEVQRYANAAKKVEDVFSSFKNIDTKGGVSGVLSNVSGALGGISEAWQSLLKLDISGVISGVADTVMGTVGTIANLGGMLHVFSSADYSGYNEMVAQYNSLISIWDEIIERKSEYISMSYGVEAMKVSREVIDTINKEIAAYRELGRERLNSGASTGSHSIGVRSRKNMNDSDWLKVAQSLGRSVDNYAGLGGRLEGLFDLSAEQLEKLRSDAPEFWAKLDDDVEKYLNSIIEGVERIDDAQEELKEQLTATTFDSVYDNFISNLSDMDKSAKDFSEDFKRYMFDAILSTEMGEKYRQRLRDWYDAMAEANGDGIISDNEIERLRQEWDNIVADAISERDNIARVTGYGSANNPDQQATYNSLEKWTYDQADELINRATAMQIINEQQYEQLVVLVQTQNLMRIDLSRIQIDVSTISSNIESITDMQEEGLGKLDQLILNTNPISEIRDTVRKIYNER